MLQLFRKIVAIKSSLYERASFQRGLDGETAGQSERHLLCSTDACLGVLTVAG